MHSFQTVDVGRCVRVPDCREIFHNGTNHGFIDITFNCGGHWYRLWCKNDLTLIAIEVICFTCSFQLRYWSMMTPRYFVELKDINHLYAHLVSKSRSFCSRWQSSSVDIFEYNQHKVTLYLIHLQVNRCNRLEKAMKPIQFLVELQISHYSDHYIGYPTLLAAIGRRGSS